MKVLMVSSNTSENIYVRSILKELFKMCDIISCVDSFWSKVRLAVDVIHIQWPEELFNWKPFSKEDLEYLSKQLDFWHSQKVKIVVTRHNEYPHYNHEHSKELYDIVFSYCDAVVHLGDFSLKKMKTPYKLNIKIPHVNYNDLYEKLGKNEARSYVRMPTDKFIYMTFGAIRAIEEEIQIIEAFKRIKTSKDVLIINNSLLMRKKESYKGKRFLQLKYFIKKIRYRIQGVVFKGERILNEDLKYYINAIDILVIPRINTLNSGVLYLGFTFGKVVVGPNIGNIGEILKQQNNPIFIPKNEKSIAEALIKGKNAIRQNIGERNKEISDSFFDSFEIARQHHNLYVQLSANK